MKTPTQRFNEKVRITPSCWVWVGAKKPAGYGNFYMNGRYFGAHCASYILHVGPIPDGLHVCHRCDNPSCVNPAHMFLGTAQENQDDCKMKGRFKRGFKVSDAQVEIIREMRNAGSKLKEIAAAFNITVSNASLICSHKSRKSPNFGASLGVMFSASPND